MQGILAPGEYAAQFSGTAQGGHVLIVSRDANRTQRFVEALGQVHDVAEVVAQNGGTTLVRVEGGGHGIVGVFVRHGVRVRWPVVFRQDHEHYTLSQNDGDPRRILDALAPYGEVRLNRETPVPEDGGQLTVPMGDLASDLTRRQLEAVLMAVRNGYYANPRRITLEELARESGVSPSTFSEHVRKGEAALMRGVAGIMDSGDVLEQVTLRGPGRPRAGSRNGY